MSLEDLIVSKEEQLIITLGLESYRGVLLGKTGKGTELYSKIEQAYGLYPKDFKIYLHKTIEKFKQLFSEVIDIKELPDEKIKLIRQEVLNYAVEERKGDTEAANTRMKALKEKLMRIRENELSSFNSDELMNIADMIESTLNSNQVIELAKSILSDKTYYGEYSSVNLQGLYMGNLLFKMELIQKLIVDFIIIHRDVSQIGEYITYLQNSNLQDMTIEDITNISAAFHINYIRKAQPDLTDEEMFNQIYNNYEINGFVFQGLNGSFLESARQNGICTNFSKNGTSSMKIIDEIFRAHGARNVLLSKLAEINESEYYWLTDNFRMASHFSFHNPECMSMLLAVGPYLSDDKEFDQQAFYRRNIDSCIENLQKLCERYHLLDEEKIQVVELAKTELEHLYPTENVMQYGGILIIPKNVVKSIKHPVKQTEQGINSRIAELLNGKIINNHKCFLDILPKAVAAIKVPTLQQILGDRNTPKEFGNIRKFIQVRQKNGKVSPLYYDIFIKSPDTSDIGCILIDETADKPYLESKKTQEHCLTVDVINCNVMLKEFDILSTTGEEVQPSFQSIMMMLAVNGVSNSKKGEQLLNKARAKFTPQKMAKYYNFLINKFFKIAGDDTFALNIRLAIVKRAISDLIPKAIYMEGTDRYPSDVNSNFLIMTQYDFHPIENFINEIANMQKQADKDKNAVNKLIIAIKEFIEVHYDFIQEDNDMCKEWLERLGFEDELIRINERILKEENLRLQ